MPVNLLQPVIDALLDLQQSPAKVAEKMGLSPDWLPRLGRRLAAGHWPQDATLAALASVWGMALQRSPQVSELRAWLLAEGQRLGVQWKKRAPAAAG